MISRKKSCRLRCTNVHESVRVLRLTKNPAQTVNFLAFLTVKTCGKVFSFDFFRLSLVDNRSFPVRRPVGPVEPSGQRFNFQLYFFFLRRSSMFFDDFSFSTARRTETETLQEIKERPAHPRSTPNPPRPHRGGVKK